MQKLLYTSIILEMATNHSAEVHRNQGLTKLQAWFGMRKHSYTNLPSMSSLFLGFQGK